LERRAKTSMDKMLYHFIQCDDQRRRQKDYHFIAFVNYASTSFLYASPLKFYTLMACIFGLPFFFGTFRE
jgi:hypothetical protein